MKAAGTRRATCGTRRASVGQQPGIRWAAAGQRRQSAAVAQPKSGAKRSFDIAFLAGSSKHEEKSAFTKYKENRNKEEQRQLQPSLEVDVEAKSSTKVATPTSSEKPKDVVEARNYAMASSFSQQNSLNMMHFPALRKLLDITGKIIQLVVFNDSLGSMSVKWNQRVRCEMRFIF